MTADDIPEMWRERIASTCYWLIDNFTVWQPFGLLLSVGALIFALTILVELWEAP